jgi:CDP-paratose 2-epimerase
VTIALVTGSGGLVGSQSARHFVSLGYDVVGIDNDMRAAFFGDDASTASVRGDLARSLGSAYEHHFTDIRDRLAVEDIFRRLGARISVVVHAAAQPSHDWAARDPGTDFSINAVGTLNLLECFRLYCPDACFIFTSTNKVYGDRPNLLRYVEQETRYELDSGERYQQGITENMEVDTCLHSVFGASKLAADVMTQEYGRYFGLKTVCFRGGTLTGPAHAAAELHGFLAYIMRCAVERRPYTVYGYKGKQVRDAIHAADLVRAFESYVRAPRPGEVYNMGGGRACNLSVLEAISLAEEITGTEMVTTYDPDERIGDHLWWVSSNAKFQSHYPDWRVTYSPADILNDIHAAYVA